MKRIRKILPFVLAAAMLGGCGAVDTVSSGLGNFVLLEDRSPGYYEQLSPQKGYSFHVPEGLEASGRTKNLIFSGSRYMNHDGFTTELHEDGSVTVTGVNNEKRVSLMIAGDILLPAGQYVLTDGGVSQEDESYYSAATIDNKGIATASKVKNFELTEADEVSVFIIVQQGVKLDGVTFYPEICRADEGDDVYDPYPDVVVGAVGGGTRALLFETDREALKNFTDDERILFDNNLAFMYKDRFEWVSISFGDGTGVQIVDCDPDGALYGKMDIYGRVWETL